jgi:hypothetical protein
MSRIVIFENLTLDGVYQSPAAPDEDPSGGFTHGGWAVPYSDESAGRTAPTTRTRRCSTTPRSTSCRGH